MSADLPVKSPTVVLKEMDEGAVLFCSRTEVYFGLNQVGSAIWNQLSDGDGTFDGLLDALQSVVPEIDRDTLAADVREFLTALEENELVTYAQSEESSR